MSDSMDIVSDEKLRQIAQQLADGASEDAAEFLAAATASQTADAAAAAGTASSAETATSGGKKRSTWNTPKYREEMDALQSRLADQSFNLADYGDPLTLVRPLQRFYEHQFSEEDKLVFAELEAEMDEHLAREGRK